MLRRYLDDGTLPYSDDEEDDEEPVDDTEGDPAAIPYRLPPPYTVDAEEDLPAEEADRPAPSVPPAKSDYQQKIDALGQVYADRPQVKRPGWLQKIAAAGVGGAAGWSNAARRAAPINADAAAENILYPGYKNKLAEWQSRVIPAESAVKLAGEQAQTEIKSQQAQSQEDLRAAQAVQAKQRAYYYQQRAVVAPKETVPVTKELADMSGGIYTIGQRIPPSEASKLAVANVARYEKTMPVTSPDLARRLGVEVGASVPSSIYQTGINAGSREGMSEPALRVAAAKGDPDAIAAVKSMDDERARTARASRNPPASVTVNTGGGLSDEALNQAADYYAKTGAYPSGIGIGKEFAPMKLAIANRAGERHKGEQLAENKSDYRANQTSLVDLTKSQSRIASSEGTASRNLDLVNTVSGRVDRTGSPLVNKYLLYLKGDVAGDDDTQLLNNAVETAANEYANVVSAGTGGGVAATNSARDHAREQLHSSMAQGTMQKVVAQMKQEMANRQASIADQIGQLRKTHGTEQPQAPSPTVGIPAGAKVRHSASNPNIVQFSVDGGQTWQSPQK